ncbi:hypothetical protein C900_05699 [Fulvivirga imtechensis AK7]|uniref:DUF2339 domain-containing protein n=1 Tax=Fulvivirga imtechensis AK7 TaxID=1237149 RepID=L8JKY0_9BACT|nr:DUF2339 domain-containing protein [Fulvivirga imtechensis]ELR68873.1 hypothetical protein C900_05699 [Fulvivirga imtechensis AK7]
MASDQEKVNQLFDKLDLLLKQQESFQREIQSLRLEIDALNHPKEARDVQPKMVPEPEVIPSAPLAAGEQKHPVKEIKRKAPVINFPSVKSDLEKFIGENLISKIGIAITVIGVAIGAKYAIDNQLISPLTRIIFGYLIGLGLLGFALKLKAKHENFSAVLLSGAMAIFYFITYAAHDFYGLFPQSLAFALMVVFTAFTVMAAIKYNMAVIAHIGLVGAYAVPFLLSDGSGKVAVLFSYMSIINTGILVVAFKRYWKSLYYSAFAFTWLIFIGWYTTTYYEPDHFGLALSFLTLFFLIFYATFLSYKLIKKEKYGKGDIVMLLLNSFIYFGIGYALLESHEVGKELPGLFTLANAVVHFVVSRVIYKNQQADKNLFYLAIGLVLVFITIAIPVQLDGNWVTLLWAGEAALLFRIGRGKKITTYEKLSYPLMLLAFFSILHDWSDYNVYTYYEPEEWMTPIFNIYFLTSMLFVAAFGYINYYNRKEKAVPESKGRNWLYLIMSFCMPAILLLTLYKAFQLEIAYFWDKQFNYSSEEYSEQNFDLLQFKSIWILNYSMFFLTVLSFVNLKKIRNNVLTYVTLGFSALLIIIFLTQGLLLLSELRESYLYTNSEYYTPGVFHILIRYISIAFAGALVFAIHKYIQQEFDKPDFNVIFDLLLHIFLLWVISSELINWMDIAGFTQSYKLGLSILWGLYSLLLIALGIIKRKKHLRIGAIALFGVTLIKLFFYDIASLDTIAKTIVFVSLGVLLLIISFLYNKYKHIIANENEG